MKQAETKGMYLDRFRAYKCQRVMASEGHAEEWNGYYVRKSELRDLGLLQKSDVENCLF